MKYLRPVDVESDSLKMCPLELYSICGEIEQMRSTCKSDFRYRLQLISNKQLLQWYWDLHCWCNASPQLNSYKNVRFTSFLKCAKAIIVYFSNYIIAIILYFKIFLERLFMLYSMIILKWMESFIRKNQAEYHCLKRGCIRRYSGLHFPVFGLNTER